MGRLRRLIKVYQQKRFKFIDWKGMGNYGFVKRRFDSAQFTHAERYDLCEAQSSEITEREREDADRAGDSKAE
ncbi:hypothetical protein FACS1894198_2840 [Clostridia bacterium]|nr:hypothetical protein FACS1894198_2840 [Clostridia bacterium]